MDLVLFISMHDASRGPMAAALFKAMADPSRAQVRSAGFRPAARLDAQVVEVMAGTGLPLPYQPPHQLTYELLEQASLVIHIGSGQSAQASPRELFWEVPLIRPRTAEGV